MKCCNPECEAPFDHREGRLIRFSWPHEEDNLVQTSHLIKHFWLCGRCSVHYVISYEAGENICLKPRWPESSMNDATHFIVAA